MAALKMNTSHRLVFGSGHRDGHHLLPEVLEVGWGVFELADRGHLRPHHHPGAYELCFILSGEVEWCTAGSLDVLRERDVYVTQPDEVHWGRDTTMHPCTLYWVILGSLDDGFTWPNLDPGIAALLNSQLSHLQMHRLRGSRKVGDAFRELFEEHASKATTAEEQVLRIAGARAALHRLLIEVARLHAQHPSHNRIGDMECQLPRSTVAAIKMLHQEAHDPDIVSRLRLMIGADQRKLNEEFMEHLGATISQYWLRQRIRLARERLMQPDIAITDVASEFGFSSSQHFATAFRRVTGLTPSEYRRSVAFTSSFSAGR